MFVWSRGLVQHFISAAYTAPRVLRYGLMTPQLRHVTFLVHTPSWVRVSKPAFWRSFSVPGRLEALTKLWERTANLVHGVEVSHKKDVLCSGLRHAPWFGTGMVDSNKREPGFFSKEICEDLLPFFPAFPDEDDYGVVGCGAIEGLRYIVGFVPTQAEALLLLRALFSDLQNHWTFHRTLRLHDVQFMLCQYGRSRKGTMRQRVAPDDKAAQLAKLLPL